MRLTFDALIVLESIHRNGSFSAAADELHRVRSALTYTVQKLESDLGVTLFDRTGHRTKLTSIGKVLIEEGNHILRSANDLEQTIKRLQTGWEEAISIAIDDTISIPKLYPLVKQFYQECPWTRLTLTAEILSGCWDALTSGRADLAIGASGDVPSSSEYGMFALGQMQFVFTISPNHPLAAIPNPLKNADIIKYRAIVAADTSRKMLSRSSGTLSGQEILTVSSIQAKIHAQIQGLGVGYLPLHLIQEYLKSKQLIIKKVEKEKPSGNFYIVWRLKKTGNALEWFLDKLKDPKVVNSILD